MCVALPGKVVEINDDRALVDFNGNKVSALTGVVDCKVGDNVLIHAGCIIQVVSMSEAEEMNDIFAAIAEEMGEVI
jgi:hydrogenase expression/formation protein HypC